MKQRVYGLLTGLCLTVGILLAVPAAALAQTEMAIFDVGPTFPRGPYSALYVDRSNPKRVAIGTADGRIAWSEDGGEFASETRVFSHRRYDAMAIRGAGTNSALGSQAATRKTQRPVRLFIRTLGTGKGVVQWHYWRSITDPLTEVSSIVLASPGGRMLAATPVGIVISDDMGGAWTRTLGAAGTMPREDVDLVGLSVIANPNKPSYVLAGTTAGVFLSRDGGVNFTPHTDPRLESEMIFEFLWDAQDPNVVLAVGPDTILQSEDAGETFEVAFVSPSEINTVVTSDLGVLIATTDGLTVVSGEGTQEVIKGESVIGVVPWDDGGLVAATNDKLIRINEYGEQELLMRTTDNDPFLRLDGAPGLAFLMSSSGVLRIGNPVERKKAPIVPVLSLSMSTVQKAMLKNLGLGNPQDTRLHARWYGKLLPRVVFDAVAVQGQGDSLSVDHTLPIDYRYDRADTYANTEFSVMAIWDFSSVVFGDHNATNPDLFIESTLRGNRDMILNEVRTRYREAAMLAHRLKNPPKDPRTSFLWQMRLEEHVAYLEFVSGRTVLKEQVLEPNQ